MVWSEFESLCRWRYRMMPLKPGMGPLADRLRKQLGPDCRISPSPGHEGFHEVINGSDWYLVYLHHASRTVYLVAHSAFEAMSAKRRNPLWEVAELSA